MAVLSALLYNCMLYEKGFGRQKVAENLIKYVIHRYLVDVGITDLL